MNDEQLQTIEQVEQFLGESEALEFKGLCAEEKYKWTETVLVRFSYLLLKRDAKGVIRRYIQKVTGYSRAQISRLITGHKRRGRIKQAPYRRHRFPRKYSSAEVMLLAKTDELQFIQSTKK